MLATNVEQISTTAHQTHAKTVPPVQMVSVIYYAHASLDTSAKPATLMWTNVLAVHVQRAIAPSLAHRCMKELSPQECMFVYVVLAGKGRTVRLT
jgi:hypothetical protein